MSLKTENLEYEAELNASHKIVEVALRHGLDESVAIEFSEFVKQCITEYVEYIAWETYMGEDL